MQVKDLTILSIKYLSGKKATENGRLFKQISDNDIIYVSHFDSNKKIGHNFTLEHFEDGKMAYKIEANNIRYKEEDSTYSLRSYLKREVGEHGDILESRRKKGYTIYFRFRRLNPRILYSRNENLWRFTSVYRTRRKAWFVEYRTL